jgi:DNA replication protein DnaC
LLQLRAGFGKDSNISESDSLKCYQKNEVLIIDDLGAEKLTDYVIQAWYSIIDYRYSNMLPTVITSNLSVAELAVRFGDRIASRIASGNVLTLRGSDRRLEKWRK